MKRICAALLVCVMFSGAVPAFGSEDLPAVVLDVVKNRDFFAKPWALYGYERCFINSAEWLYDERVGVILLAPSGFEYSLVYDVATMEAVYKDTRINEKGRREDMKRKSISVTDALKLAKFAVSHADFEVKRGWDNYDDPQDEQQDKREQKNESDGAANDAEAETPRR